MASQKTSDTSLLIAPIELGSSTITQLLNARGSVTKEVLDYLEKDCDAILECRQCRSLFRSLANFISHKRIYCKDMYRANLQTLQARYPTQPTTVIQPTDPDTDQLASQTSKPMSNAKRTIAPNKKAKPIRKTTPSDLARVGTVSKSSPLPISVSPIDGVSCAVSQAIPGSEVDGRSSVAASSSDNTDLVTVQPKDGYPNMNLRQRSSKTNLSLADSDWEDVDEDDFIKMPFTNKNKNLSSKATVTELLSKRTDCDRSQMKCLTCNTTFATLKTLNFHMLSKHGKQRKNYPCIYCNNVFTQFWGVTRHLKKAHGLTGDSVDKIREQIRSRVYTDSSTDKPSTGTTKQPTGDATLPTDSDTLTSTDPQTALKCDVCSKVFPKRQYLHLHMIACYKKAGKEPPTFKKRVVQQPKTSKPLLFVCKSCNRAFSMRQNMVQHAIACSKRHKDSNNDKQESKGGKVLFKSEREKTNSTSSREKASSASDRSKTNVPSTEQVEKKPGPKIVTAAKKDKNESTPVRGKLPTEKDKQKNGDKPSLSPKLDADDILMQLSPSDEAKEEEMNQTPPVTPTSIAQSRPKRTIKPKQFSDGTIRLLEKVPEVVKIQQPDGSLVYKLREDVEASAVAPPSKMSSADESEAKEPESIVKAKDTKGVRILIQGESVPLLDADDEAKIGRMIDIRKLVCLKCKRQYGSSSNLRRHVVRHLGWRRYKCKLCKFTSYNKSECKSHLRKCHHSEVATLLDGGLTPYIIDLGALLDDSNDEHGSKLNLSLPAENGRQTPTSRKTRARSKEPNTDLDSKDLEPESPKTDSLAGSLDSTTMKKMRGRPRKQAFTKSTTTKSASSVKSVASSESSDVGGAKPRGRAPRKQELRALSNSELVPPPQDENNKRPNADSGQSEASIPKVAKIAKKPVDPVKQKEQTNKLEGLVNKLKTVRKPLIGAEDNSKSNTDLKDSNKGEEVPDVSAAATSGDN